MKYKSELKLEIDQILSKIDEVNLNEKYNIILVPISIFNLLALSDEYTFANDLNIISPLSYDCDEQFLHHVGSIKNMTVYVNMNLSPDEVILTIDIQKERDNKINTLLNNTREKYSDFHKLKIKYAFGKLI